jgi:hypothetical protein
VAVQRVTLLPAGLVVLGVGRVVSQVNEPANVLAEPGDLFLQLVNRQFAGVALARLGQRRPRLDDPEVVIFHAASSSSGPHSGHIRPALHCQVRPWHTVVHRGTRSRQVTASLRERISSGAFSPGSQLPVDRVEATRGKCGRTQKPHETKPKPAVRPKSAKPAHKTGMYRGITPINSQPSAEANDSAGAALSS